MGFFGIFEVARSLEPHRGDVARDYAKRSGRKPCLIVVIECALDMLQSVDDLGSRIAVAYYLEFLTVVEVPVEEIIDPLS